MTANINYNPDVLSCLANLSNDEVFTPPVLVNQMLDLLPPEIWTDPNATFLDPVTKSGVFLREIAKRLMKGLEPQMPGLRTRVNHIFKNQLFGIAITELTGQLARRSVYCSKTANGKYSICDSFGDPQGNIIFERYEHTWKNDKCVFCGASQEEYDRGEDLESYAYPFIHTENSYTFFNMKFDVIIGNPPYQLKDGGFDQSASPLYHLFVQHAKKLNPRYLIMIIPARWYSGGKGLDEFRSQMLNDKRIAEIHDYPETTDCFPGLNIRGGVCYFLWNRDYNGDCQITTYKNGKIGESVLRPLLEDESDTFIRYNEAISILKKIRELKEESFKKFVSTQKPFGLRTYIKGQPEHFVGSVKLYQNGGIGYIDKDTIIQNKDWIDQVKVLVTRSSPGSDVYPHQVIGPPILSEKNSCCTETYMVVGPFATEKIAQNVISYMKTKFFRFLMMLIKNSQDVPRKVYGFVPIQDFSQSWTDDKLLNKYNITNEEIAFIDTLIRPMEQPHG